jgi:hypothetical protein
MPSRLTCALVAVALSAFELGSPPACLAQGQGQTFAAVTGGATLTDLAGGGSSSDSRWGATAGLLLGLNAGRTAAGLEGNWIQKGGSDTRLDYVEVPLTFGGIADLSGGDMRGRLYTGVSVAFKVSCSSTDVICDSANGTEWGWPLGIQLGRRTGLDSFAGVDIRYTFALSDALENVGVYNRPWQFRVMFGKALGGR